MNGFNLIDYAPIGLMFLVAAGFAASQILATQLFGPQKRTKIKLMPYECGKDPVGSARERFSVKFYTVAVVFLLFDLEVLFIVPFAVSFKQLLAVQNAGGFAFGTTAFVEMAVFIATLIVGLIYAWKKGAFDWSVQARVEAKAEAVELKKKRKQELREAREKLELNPMPARPRIEVQPTAVTSKI
jgi:NADH-quinone oxidoreductase subunit A